jgi:hypothetical protein
MKQGFAAPISEFLTSDENALVGSLATAVAATGIESQRSAQFAAWRDGVRILKAQLSAPEFRSWYIALEYELPRRWKRPDAILLADGLIFVVELKLGAKTYDASARWQAEDYALNLRDFHAESHGRIIVPVLCASEAACRGDERFELRGAPTAVSEVLLASRNDLGELLLEAYGRFRREGVAPIDPLVWLDSPYRPTATIVEAAVSLYERHGVREISHSYAYNLNRTTEMLARAIEEARKEQRRIICFITGIPGAGKTLTGLNAVHDPDLRSNFSAAGIFLSGNGPLVKVVREALVMSQVARGRRRRDCEHEVSTFIQNVHQFLRHHRENPQALPHEHVVVFDEAQRAWDQAQMSRKQGVDASEASLVLEVMERLPDWCAVVALVGGGQEIFLGEAGLEEWGRALAARPVPWRVIASPEVLGGGVSVAGHRLFQCAIPASIDFRAEQMAHLAVGVRSHRAQRLAEWVNDLLEFQLEGSRRKFPDPHEFPVVLTRDLELARAWLRARSAGDPNRRCGLVATSEDQRLRAHGIEGSSAFRRDYPFEKWFLAPPEDCRSSFSLEVAASEFECQGLELDWVGVCWGGDLLPVDAGDRWEYRKFRGAGWQNVRQDAERAYVCNRYRVLLTRARQGMVIWVPPGDANDSTRDPAAFNRLHACLRTAGVPYLAENFAARSADLVRQGSG